MFILYCDFIWVIFFFEISSVFSYLIVETILNSWQPYSKEKTCKSLFKNILEILALAGIFFKSI